MGIARAVYISWSLVGLFACAQASSAGPDAQARDAGGSGDSGPADAALLDCSSQLAGWQALGAAFDAVGTAGTHADSPSVAVGGDGMPVVAWTEGQPASLYVRRFTGLQWQAMGGAISVNPGNTPVYTPRLAARGGDVVAVFAEAGGASGTGFYARRWAGAEWQVLGGGELSGANTDVSGGDVVFDARGDAIVAWSQYTPGEIGRNRIQVRRLAGDAEVALGPELGGVAGPGASAITPSLVVDASGAPVVAFSESGVRAFVRDAQDSGWLALGGDQVSPLGSAVGAHSPRLYRTAGGPPYLAVAEYDSATTTSNGYVLEWSGNDWQLVGGALDREPGVHTYVQDLVVDGEGRPIIAWTEGDARQLLYIQRWSGAGFSDLGDMPLSGFGGVNSVTAAQLAVDTCGRPIAVFSEAGGSDRMVHVFRYHEPAP